LITGRILAHSGTSTSLNTAANPMKSPRLMLVKSTEMRLVAAKGRQPNAAYRVREHLTESLSRSFMSGALRIEAPTGRHYFGAWIL
jgi:hypothetical protein